MNFVIITITGRGYKHRDKDFRELLKAVDAPRFCKRMMNEEGKKVYMYECMGCSLQYVRRRQINTKDMSAESVKETNLDKRKHLDSENAIQYIINMSRLYKML